jgi:hypothetical protein
VGLGPAHVAARADKSPRIRECDLPQPHFFVPGLNAGADSAELLVDRERGVLLRLASLLDRPEV